MTSPNFPTPFMSSAVASKGRARHKACGIAGKIDIIRRVGARSAEGRRRPGWIPGPNKLPESLIYFTSVEGSQASLHDEAVPRFSRRAGGLTYFWRSGGPEFEKLVSDLSGIRKTFYRFELLWEVLRQASLHNEAVQDSWTALYFGLGFRIRARPSVEGRAPAYRFSPGGPRP